MTDYKYRVYDGATGNEFGDVRVLSLALHLRDQLIESYPQVTIDEIVPEVATAAPVRTPQVGDRVRGVGNSITGKPSVMGEYTGNYDTGDGFPHGVIADNGDQRWFASVELV